MDVEWGFALDRNIIPVGVSEFGADTASKYDMEWFRSLCNYLEEKDVVRTVRSKEGGAGERERVRSLERTLTLAHFTVPCVPGFCVLAPERRPQTVQGGPKERW